MRPRGVTAHARWKIGPEIVALTLTAELAVRAPAADLFSEEHGDKTGGGSGPRFFPLIQRGG
jgi:hypothetical protein